MQKPNLPGLSPGSGFSNKVTHVVESERAQMDGAVGCVAYLYVICMYI